MMPADTSPDNGVCSRTCGTCERPRLHCSFRSRMRRAIRALPMARWKRKASSSAQRCSKEWKPPGVICPALGMRSGVSPRHIPSKVGTVGPVTAHPAAFAQISPVPRGPKIHLWQPAMNTSTPSEAAVWSIFIEAAPVRFDGLLHRRRMRGEEEHRHVDPCRVQRELPAYLLPVGKIGRRLAGRGVVGAALRE